MSSSPNRLDWTLAACMALSGATLALFVHGPALGFTFEEVDKLDKFESSELLTRARQAAERGDTSGARKFIAQAAAKGAAPAQVRAAEAAVVKVEDARRADDTRRRAEAEAQARPSNKGSGGSAAGDGKTWVSVEAECITGFACFVSNLKVSGGPGRFESSAAASGRIAVFGGQALAGSYTYSYVIEAGRKRCSASGSFTLDGTRGSVKVGHYPDCRFSHVWAN